MGQMCRLGWLAVLASLLSALAFCTLSFASPCPPTEGDWVIEAGEEVTFPNPDCPKTDVTLPGNIIVYGHLILDNCTLRFTSSEPYRKGLSCSGRLDATDTVFTSATDNGAYLSTEGLRGLGISNLTHCTFDKVRAGFGGESTNTLSDCSFDKTSLAQFTGNSVNTCLRCFFKAGPGQPGGQTNSDSQTTFGNPFDDPLNPLDGCDFVGAFTFVSPSRSTLAYCRFLPLPDPPYSAGRTHLWVRGETQIGLQDLTPGVTLTKRIEATNNAYLVDFVETSVGVWTVMADEISTVTVGGSELSWMACGGYSQSTLVDTTIHEFTVGAYGDVPPNVFVLGVKADGLPLTSDVDKDTQLVRSDNTPFKVIFQNTRILGAGLNFAGSPDNVVDECLITFLATVGNTLTEVSNSQVRGQTSMASLGLPGARMNFHDCTLQDVVLGGDAQTIMDLSNTALTGYLAIHNSFLDPQTSSPQLLLSGTTSFTGTDTRVIVTAGVLGAWISGEVEVDPSRHVEEWAPGSTVIRQYPVRVVDGSGNGVSGAMVWVESARGVVEWGPQPTDEQGWVYPEVTFTFANYEAEFRVIAEKDAENGGRAEAPISFLTSTVTHTPEADVPGIVLTISPATFVSTTSFENTDWLGLPPLPPVALAQWGQMVYPWTEFAAGPGTGVTWRQVGDTVTGGIAAPPAHSGAYLMASDLSGEAIAGLRLALPKEPSGPFFPQDYSFRAWTWVGERSDAGTSSFFGFGLAEAYPSSSSPWLESIGWEVLSDTQSQVCVGDTTVPVEVGFGAGAWHLVELKYNRRKDQGSLCVSLDGRPVTPEPVPVPNRPLPDDSPPYATYAVLGAVGETADAHQRIFFDDASLSMMVQLANTDVVVPTGPYALLNYPEQVVEGGGPGPVLHFGLGYPLLKNYAYGPPQELDFWVGATFPDGYQFISSDPLPDRVVGGQPVWHITGSSSDSSYHDQVVLEVEIPAGPTLADIYAWATSDPRAATVNPPSGTERDRLYDGVWHYRQDLMVQRVLPAEENVPVLKVTKQGPAHASPGDRVDYTVIVLNCGNADAEDVLVTDDWPGEMQVPGPPILGNIDLLEPGDIWGTSTHGVLKWELDDGTEVTNWANAYLVDDPSRKGSGHTTLTIQVAADPNHISVSPTGGVDRKQTLTYTLECENVGAGTAYGVYASVLLSPRLDDFTLSLGEGLSYDPDSRILTWEVGTLLSKQGATTSFSVQVAWNAARARPVVEQAVVYFPSVPEETPTNVVADIVNGSFSDVLWDHWAVLQVELTYENGIVQGYPDGTYRPSNVVDRGQMAVYMARALAGGDAHVPTGPAEPTFSDVLTDHWAYKYVEYAVAEGVVVGYPDGTYRPTQQVTRGQMAVYVARAMVAPAGDEGVPDPPAEPTFLDVTGTSEWVWCYPHVEYVVDEGVVGGYADGTYRPQYTVTRDQMAVYVTRAFRLPM